MDFSFTEEQELLAENLVEFMDREYPESLIKECDEQKRIRSSMRRDSEPSAFRRSWAAFLQIW